MFLNTEDWMIYRNQTKILKSLETLHERTSDYNAFSTTREGHFLRIEQPAFPTK